MLFGFKFIEKNINIWDQVIGLIFLKMIQPFIIASFILALATSCHYSCATCTNSLYTGCLSCNSSSQLTVLLDPNTIPSRYWSSVYASGTCLNTFSFGANALGILLFIILVTACLIIRTKESFYLLLTLQTYGLYSLIEIAWVNPIHYVLQALQYFMIFNTMGQGYKNDDYVLMSSGNYRLDMFLQQTSIGPNLAIIAPFTLISFILLIIICIVSVKRKKQAEKQAEAQAEEQKQNVVFQAMLNKSEVQKNNESKLDDQQDSKICKCWKWVSQEALIPIAKLLICILYLMIQQTVLVLLVSLVFITPVNTGIIALCIIYLHILVFVMSYAYYYRVEYFKQKNVMYINFAKKIVLPVMVVVPISKQYIFFLFAGAILVIQFIIDFYNELYKSINRLAVYKVSQILSVSLLIIYQITEVAGKSYSSSKAAAIACVFVLALNLFFFCIQIAIGTKERFFSKGNNKIQTTQIAEPKSIQEDYTLQNLQQKNNQNRTVQIIQIEENDNDRDSNQDQNSNGEDNNEENNKIQQPINTNQNQSINYNQYNIHDNTLQTRKEKADQNKVTPLEPPKKKRRKQILDKQLRMRYGI